MLIKTKFDRGETVYGLYETHLRHSPGYVHPFEIEIIEILVSSFVARETVQITYSGRAQDRITGQGGRMTPEENCFATREDALEKRDRRWQLRCEELQTNPYRDDY